MRLERLAVQGFRNLADGVLRFPDRGAIFLGSNGQGKTNLLEAIYYPVLFRSFRGAGDQELVRFGGPGFRIESGFLALGTGRESVATFETTGRHKRIELDGVPIRRLADAAGEWLAVTFLPSDVNLAAGAAAVRRHFLDRTLALSDRGYLRALSGYRAALAQRNAALRQGRTDLARAFDAPLAQSGARIVRARIEWTVAVAPDFAVAMAAFGREGAAALSYSGRTDLVDVAAWPAALDRAQGADRARGVTTTGPHRDDLRLTLDGHELRRFGSTGQQRTAAIALKLLERDSLRRARGVEPALLLDDVFAELDRERQARLAAELTGENRGQVFLTSPRADELPAELELPRWRIELGAVLSDSHES